jgi:uncharacterized membrane protein
LEDGIRVTASAQPGDQTMAKQAGTLVALVFDDPYKGDEARASLNRMEGEGLIELEETAVIVKKPNGKVRVSQDVNVVDKDKHIGHIAGLLTAAATGTMPFILGGTIAGNLIGRLTDNGITNKFLNSVKKELQAGTSVLVLYGRSDEQRRKKLVDRLAAFNPRILESDLPVELEEAFDEAIAAHRGAGALR